MKKLIVAEKLLWSNDPIPITPPRDYKADVINGWILYMCVKVHNPSKPSEEPIRYYFSPDFQLINCKGELMKIHHISSPTRLKDVPMETIEKPKCWDVLLEYSSILGANFPFVRADFYVTNRSGTCREKVVIGEMTFFPMAGWLHYNLGFDEIFGKYFTLANFV